MTDLILTENLVNHLLEMKEIEIPSTLTDPLFREAYKNEVLVLQSMAKKMQEIDSPMSPEWLSGIYMGMETILRRLQDIEQAGLREVYKQNFKKD